MNLTKFNCKNYIAKFEYDERISFLLDNCTEATTYNISIGHIDYSYDYMLKFMTLPISPSAFYVCEGI